MYSPFTAVFIVPKQKSCLEVVQGSFGPTGGVDPESFVRSRYIVIWACNTLSTNLHHWPFIKRAQDNGAKVVVIGAYKSRTAKHADWHIAPRPGTDGALAMAWINLLTTEDLLDHDYFEKYTVGFKELKARAEVSAQHRGAEEPRFPQLLLRQRGEEDSGPGRVIRAPQRGGCRGTRHQTWRQGARVERQRPVLRGGEADG